MAEEMKLSGKTPQFGGSTGGLLTKAEIEEKYAITWTSSKEQVFEMPTGGAAKMRQGVSSSQRTVFGTRRTVANQV